MIDMVLQECRYDIGFCASDSVYRPVLCVSGMACSEWEQRWPSNGALTLSGSLMADRDGCATLQLILDSQ